MRNRLCTGMLPSGWQAVVAVATPAPATPQPTTLAPNDPEARYKLVLDIQQQLRRVGCYPGRMDGSWGIGTKDAMKEFTNRVNATLPLDEPDYVQLTLIQSHSDTVCGACPAGQSPSASGRCVGLPIMAQTKRDDTPQVAATQKEVLRRSANAVPGAPAGQLLFKPVPTTTVITTEPLPSRMAIGGPVPHRLTRSRARRPSLSSSWRAPVVGWGSVVDERAVWLRRPTTLSPIALSFTAASAPRSRVISLSSLISGGAVGANFARSTTAHQLRQTDGCPHRSRRRLPNAAAQFHLLLPLLGRTWVHRTDVLGYPACEAVQLIP